MLKSIERTARIAGLPLDKVDLRGPRDWGRKTIYEKTKAVGLESAYLAAVGGGSNTIHGNWQEIAGNNLSWDEFTDRFTPNMDWALTRPQVPLALNKLIIDTLEIYFSFMAGPAAFQQIAPALADLAQRINYVSTAHENYLAPKTWPGV